jgi:hypothetical protein
MSIKRYWIHDYVGKINKLDIEINLSFPFIDIENIVVCLSNLF